MFFPNTTAKIRRASGKTDVRGERTYAAAVDIRCSVVSLNLEVEKTSVRADSSGSRGRAEEEMGAAKILFPHYERISEKDIVQIDGETLEVIGVQRRRNLLGGIDHLEVDFKKGIQI